ncbi:carbohydrate kinase family protein [Asticcacaulis sp. 201]|uniref:carbohydrate kinase family protein n=1 Tax=Asticcacaulis sp. 201 TaxID=3028787 RepID=UPI00291681A1|nr:carbohydrate kinase family protein [Asticcacaulis sp. 201]MDV6331206.1 carbohydrate kinase family protein [Asticcacaulis sp. 201]
MSNGKKIDVAVVGEIYIDHVFTGFHRWPAPGEEVTTDAYAREVGGGAATTACGLARLGRKVNLIGLIGDSDAAWIGQRLSGFGVGLDGLRLTPQGATGVTVSVSTQGDRSFFTHVGVNKDLSGVLIAEETLSHLTCARHVHFALPLERHVARELLPRLKAAGVTTSIDVGFQPQWLNEAANSLTLAEVDHFLPNEKEVELWCGSTHEDAFFAKAAAAGFTAPMFKCGPRGAITTIDGIRYVGEPPKVVAVDTTGAGDAFDAGFIDALLDHEPPTARLHRACIVGALSTRAAGALGALPDTKELRSIL